MAGLIVVVVVALRVWCQGVATVIEIVAAAALRAVQIRNFENSLNNALLDV